MIKHGPSPPDDPDLPTESDLDEGADWWRKNAPPEARGLIDAKRRPEERVKLFVDGNCGCALLGEDLGSGEVEFVVMDDGFRTQWPNLTERELKRAACKQAYHNLIARLGRPLSFVYLPPMEWILDNAD